MQLRAELAAPLTINDSPLGTRLILNATGGTFTGVAEGVILPGGGDWVLKRSDGIAQLDIRFALRTNDDHVIYVRSAGLVDMQPHVSERIRKGEPVDPNEYYFRTCVFFEAPAEAYRNLNRRLAVGIGCRTMTGMVTDVFTVL